MINKVLKGIKAINPNAEASVGNDSIDEITWLNNTTPISKSEIQSKITELETAYNNEEWKRNRQAE